MHPTTELGALSKRETFCFQDYHPDIVPWPSWVSRTTNISHFLLTFACSANFYIYFAKHSQKMQRLVNFRKWFSKPAIQEADDEDGDEATTTANLLRVGQNSSKRSIRTRSPNTSFYSVNYSQTMH